MSARPISPWAPHGSYSIPAHAHRSRSVSYCCARRLLTIFCGQQPACCWIVWASPPPPVRGMRRPRSQESGATTTEDETGNVRSGSNLLMNGAEIFTFTLAVVPQCIERLFARSGLTMDNIDLFVFHQANQYMLEHLRNRMDIPKEKFFVRMSHCGNTVAS